MLEPIGVILIEFKAAAVTDAVVVPTTGTEDAYVAVTVIEPGVTGVNIPLVPATLLSVATAGADEVQVTELVISREIPSE